jgi:hypothetical protein
MTDLSGSSPSQSTQRSFGRPSGSAVSETSLNGLPHAGQGFLVSGRDRDDRYDRDRRQQFDRQRFDSDTTVGIGQGGLTIGPPQRCRMETTTNERDGRWITREERRCD